MDELQFLWIEAWPLALGAVILGLLLHLRARAKDARLSALAGPRTLALVSGNDARQARAARWCASFGILFAALALLEPSLSEGEIKAEARGLDLVFVLDVSRSMLARDLSPNRLLRAKAEIGAVSRSGSGDRWALIAFAGDAQLRIPLTADHEAFLQVLLEIDDASVERGGSDLGAAISLAAKALPAEDARHAAIILLTDGEDLGGQGQKAAAALGPEGPRLHAVGLGTVRGAKIPVIRADGSETWLRDASGREVQSAIDQKGLEAIADAGRGTYTDAATGTSSLLRLYQSELAPMAAKTYARELRKARISHGHWPLLLALICTAAEFALSSRRSR